MKYFNGKRCDPGERIAPLLNSSLFFDSLQYTALSLQLCLYVDSGQSWLCSDAFRYRQDRGERRYFLRHEFYCGGIKIVDADQDIFKDIEGEADTLAGLILEIKGELPQKNEVITYHEHQFTILEVDNRRIKKIKYEKKS